jgi:hypothetical protein
MQKRTYRQGKMHKRTYRMGGKKTRHNSRKSHKTCKARRGGGTGENFGAGQLF